MRISEVHAFMVENELMRQGQNKGVRAMWKRFHRADAASRDSQTAHGRTKRHRLGKCNCRKLTTADLRKKYNIRQRSK